jgi:hypothetical protein
VIVRSLAAALVLAAAPAAPAGACPPSVQLRGDAGLVAAIADALHLRGIATAERDCPSVTAYVERREQTISVRIATVQPIEREVREVETAATVIESFTRDLATLREEPPSGVNGPGGLPTEPWGFARLGVALRYGAR